MEYASELLLAKANHNHLRIRKMEASEEAARHTTLLSELLNARETLNWVVSDTVIRPISLMEAQAVNEVEVYESYSQRPEYSILENSISVLELERKTTTKGLSLPTLQVGGYGSMFGNFFTPLYPTAEFNVGLMWDLPLGRLIKRGEVQQFDQKILLQKNLSEQFRDQVSREIGEAKLSINSAKARMEVAIESMEFASKALDQSIQRQRLRTARPYEVRPRNILFRPNWIISEPLLDITRHSIGCLWRQGMNCKGAFFFTAKAGRLKVNRKEIGSSLCGNFSAPQRHCGETCFITYPISIATCRHLAAYISFSNSVPSYRFGSS
ncbi:TolC family protein [bacterium]|nr:TolC family protein [bacterium]